MATAISRENYFWHKVHSLTGIFPVGYYLVQHLTLNSFTIAGPAQFNGVIDFFHALPTHMLVVMLIAFVWGPLLFHAIYGLFIVNRAQPNLANAAYKWRENRMYTMQRYSGIFIFAFLAYHTTTTSLASKISGNKEMIQYAAWQEKLSSFGYIFLIIYMLGVAASCYHLGYGLWNFCIRWGITVSEKSQMRMQKVAVGTAVGLTLLGWAALFGFLMHKPEAKKVETVQMEQPFLVTHR